MCIFSQPKVKETFQQVAPPPAPAPMPVATDTDPIKTADSQRNRLKALQYGAASTIKTGPQGIVGAGPELNSPSASAMFPGQKKTLGA